MAADLTTEEKPVPSLFYQHLSGCTPLAPCAACQTITFLRKKLPSGDFQEVLRISGDSKPTRTSGQFDAELVDSLGLSTRAVHALKRANIHRVDELAGKTKEEIARLDNVGRVTLREIEETLEKVGKSLSQ